MAEFTLPANSKIGAGKTWPASPSPKRLRRFSVYRWNPEDSRNPVVDTYSLDLAECGPMVLDALIKIKNEIDTTDLSPLLPRGGMRLLRDEHRRDQHAGLHQGDRRDQ